MANRRILACILATMIIIVAGCGKTNKTKSPTTESATNTVGVSVGTQEIPSENTPSVENTQTAEPTVDVTQSAEKTTPPTLVPSVDNTQSPSASEQTATVKPTAEPTVKPTSKPTVNVKPTVKPTATPTKAPTSKPTATEEEEIAYYRRLAAETVTEINKLRNVQLIVLPGLTEYAEYRAKQLETNFAHDGLDQEAAANALKYGRYIDMTKYGRPAEDSFYQVDAGEAISTGLGELAAAGFRRSPGHWSYVGSDEYLYIGVGASKGGTCVCVAMVNTDLLK